ncbi:VWA domain-containing protein [Alkalimarinus alittae]|uniref:VWA domain-containing protein n=1 Tax=Alkalimarinus alittae TaxID=2961619 RepID=A0ABY6N6G0_9ALTE|nr:VWA domain-containing protein [Alkalimarinus alittae]UZE97577.1 VWA domain-containing protein [Alkalimarinus alittae]
MSFFELASQFHFLRPLWLLALIIVPIVLWLSTKAQTYNDSDWNKAIPPELLQHLMVGEQTSSSKSTQHWKWFAIIIAIMILALAGPTWIQKPQPLHQQSDNLAVVLDLSLSMLASDQKPDRLTRAKHKLRDLLEQRKEGNTALIVYSGDSYVVTPLTDDTNTLKSMLPPLDPFIMPAMGSRPDLAIKQAINVLKNGGGTGGKILLITDGIEENNLQQIESLLKETHFPLSVLAVGTEEGGPINIPERGYLKDNGSVIIPKTDFNRLNQLAANHSGIMARISFSDSDIEALKAITDADSDSINTNDKNDDTLDENSLYDQWHDAGYLFALLLIPIVLLGHRKGAFSLVLLLSFTLQPNDVMAFEWKDLWKTPDQQAMEIVHEDPAKAAELFQDPQWKGIAQYKAKQFEQAQQSFETESSTTSLYNQATALARQQKFEEAVAAYDEVLKQDPNFDDAASNKALIEKFLEEQEPKDQQSSEQSEQSEQGDSDSKDQQENQDQQQNQGQDQQGENSEQQDSQDSGSEGEPQDQQQSQSEGSENQPSDQGQQGQDPADKQSEAQQAQEKSEQEAEEQKQAQQTDKSEPSEQQSAEEQQAQGAEQDELTDEETQAFEQWMRRVPDDPGGLLRRKFSQQYQQKRGQQSQPEGQPIW